LLSVITIDARIIFAAMDFVIIIDQVLKVAAEAADFIRSEAGKVQLQQIETKSPNSLVSYVDKQAEKIIVKGLAGIIENAGFITEEETTAQKKSEFTWIIDPLDGTTNFLQQIPVYAVSIGLMHEDRLVLGVVIDVERKETFYAWKGGGAWCNGTPIHVSDKHELKDALVATGFPYAAMDVLPQLTSVFEYFLKNARGIRRLGSAAIDLAYVACGRFDVYYETSLHAWDIAGGIVLIEEAGGIVTDFSGQNNMLESGQLVASPFKLHSSALQNIQKIFNL
jgi:myo-inositol-1(or 4)-monophosphatase